MSFSREIAVFVDQVLDPNAAALDFARRARADFQAEVDAGRFPRSFRTFVDGRQDAPETSVKPGGSIVYEASLGVEVVLFALAFLHARSPRGSMAKSGPRLYRQPYRESFYVAVDGRFIAPGDFDPARAPMGAEYIIGNVQPYSRKVDVQTVGKRKLRFLTAPNLFADAARAINAQFGNYVTARRVYSMDFPGRYVLRQTQMRGGSESHRVKRGAGTPVESPAIIITPRR